MNLKIKKTIELTETNNYYKTRVNSKVIAGGKGKFNHQSHIEKGVVKGVVNSNEL